MGYKKCCVPACTDKVSSQYRFPHPISGKARFQVWLDIIQNPELEGMSFEEIYATKRVCRQHFTENCFSVNKRNLNYGAIPTVDVLEIQRATSWNYKESQDYQPSRIMPVVMVNVEQPSTSPSIDFRYHSPSTVKDDSLNALPALTASETNRKDCTTPTGKHCKSLLEQLGVTRQIQLTPKKRKLYKQLSTMKKKMYAVNQKKLSFKKRLSLAQKYSSRDMAMFTAHTSPTVLRFFESQLRLAGTKLKGRRFTFQEKVLALSLFNCLFYQPGTYRKTKWNKLKMKIALKKDAAILSCLCSGLLKR